MNKKTIMLGTMLGIFFVNGMFASDPAKEKEELDINSIAYIEEEFELELGFDTADYLPEGFDASTYYFDTNSVVYIETPFEIGFDTRDYLPEGFDAYAYPNDVQSINYIDEADNFVIDYTDQRKISNYGDIL